MWYIESVSQLITANDGSATIVDIGPEHPEAYIQGDGETVLLIKTADGNTRSIIHIGADGAASVARTKSSAD